MAFLIASRTVSSRGTVVPAVIPGNSARYRKLNDGIVSTVTESTPSSVLAVIGSICMAMSASPVCSI